jgi:hypothetical protein
MMTISPQAGRGPMVAVQLPLPSDNTEATRARAAG